jgi:hypothetical protein
MTYSFTGKINQTRENEDLRIRQAKSEGEILVLSRRMEKLEKINSKPESVKCNTEEILSPEASPLHNKDTTSAKAREIQLVEQVPESVSERGKYTDTQKPQSY